MIEFNECLNKYLKKVEPDLERIESIIEQAKKRLERAKKETKNISFKIEDYYEVIKELLVAYLLKNGFKSRNHQCLISFYYKNNSDKEFETYLISQMSLYRNRLIYYGEEIPLAFYKKNQNNIEEIIESLFSFF